MSTKNKCQPLTAISPDSRDAEPISPAHILYPASISHSSAHIIPANPITDADQLRHLWKKAQSRVNAFWKSWSKDYVTMLHDRKKWKKTIRDLRVDDIVLIVDETVNRGCWKTGRV